MAAANYSLFPIPFPLNKVLDEVFTLTRQHVDDGNLNHCVAAGLQTHGGTGHIDQYLTADVRDLDFLPLTFSLT